MKFSIIAVLLGAAVAAPAPPAATPTDGIVGSTLDDVTAGLPGGLGDGIQGATKGVAGGVDSTLDGVTAGLPGGLGDGIQGAVKGVASSVGKTLGGLGLGGKQ